MKIWNCTSDFAIKIEVAGQNFIPFGNMMDVEYPSRNKFTFLLSNMMDVATKTNVLWTMTRNIGLNYW